MRLAFVIAALTACGRIGFEPVTPRPTWAGEFADGSSTICEAFETFVRKNGAIDEASAAYGAAVTQIDHDILGFPRSGAISIGAFEP